MNRRITISIVLLFLVFFGLSVRVALISVDDTVKTVGNHQGAKTLLVTEARGTIYDRHRTPLVNDTNVYYASILPQIELAQRLEGNTSPSEYNRLLNAVHDGIPARALLNGPTTITTGLQLYIAPKRYAPQCLAPHLIGYLNGEKTSGTAGIERAYDDLLKQFSGQITVTYPTDGSGRYRADAEIRVSDTIKQCQGGIVLTIDRGIQEKIENIATSHITKGAIVVLDAENGDVLASGSYPTFHPESTANIAEGALINRALSLFDCGSVFKIVTTLAALEKGVSVDQIYECSGAITVNGTTFHCHHRLGHQMLDMETAFAQSCNVYFIQLAQHIGASSLLNMARQLGLCEEIEIAETLYAPASVLPTAADLSADAALANLSFGQGKLLITPMHIARMTAVIAGDGTLFDTSAVLGAIDAQGRWIESRARGGETVISASSVASVRRMMEQVVTEGTGSAARSNTVSVAGKTGTAETGQLNNGKAVTHSWFTGYFPAENPQYVVTVLIEDMTLSDKNAAEVFCEISNNLI